MALDAKGVYGQFLIKKRRYWLKHVPGDLINGHMARKPLSATGTYVQSSFTVAVMPIGLRK